MCFCEMNIEDEKNPILKTSSDDNNSDKVRNKRVYKRRWWVTFVFCLCCFIQALIWNTWGPIAESSEIVFGWTDGTVAQVTNMSAIVFAIFVLPFGSFMDAKGLRVSMVLCSTVILASALVRCFTMDPVMFTPLAHVSAALQGFGGLITYSGPALFAATWFPLRERTSITAVGSFFNYFGGTIAFIVGPQLVPGPVYNTSTNTSVLLEVSNRSSSDVLGQNIANMELMKTGIRNVLYAHVALAGIAFLLVILYFPARPPTPPSVTASLPRENYRESFRKMFSNTQLYIVVAVGAIPRSFFGSWTALFDVVVKPVGVSQVDAGWISFWNTLVGCAAGIVFAKVSDVFVNHRKALVISLTVLAVLSCIWAALLCDQMIYFNIESLYVSSILLGLLVHGLVPLFYEMSAETAYPVGEGASGGFLTLGFCIFEIIYMGLVSIPGIGISWMTWTCVGSLIVSLPLMAIFKGRNKRYDIDIGL